MLPLTSLLAALEGEPRTPDELARALGTTPAALSGMLRTLQAGGYVQPAEAGVGACACGPCALKSLCRNAENDEPPLHLLRLTDKGRGRLKV